MKSIPEASSISSIQPGYGQTRLRFGPPERSDGAGDGAVLYEASGDGEISVALSFVTCHDDMSGEAFPMRAEVRYRGRTYRGCGRALQEAGDDP